MLSRPDSASRILGGYEVENGKVVDWLRVDPNLKMSDYVKSCFFSSRVDGGGALQGSTAVFDSFMKSTSNISLGSMSFVHKDSVIKSSKCGDVENSLDGVSLVHKDVGCLEVSDGA